MTKAQIFNNGTGTVEVDGGRVFTFAVKDGHLLVKDDDGTQIADRSVRADNGEEKNEIESLGIACEEVGGYFD